MSAKYTITLYEMGCLYSGRRDPSWKGDIEKLRETLGIEPKKLKRWFDLRRFVLEIARDEINHLAHFTLTWKEIRKRRKVAGIELYFWRKDAVDTNAAADELNRPQVALSHVVVRFSRTKRLSGECRLKEKERGK